MKEINYVDSIFKIHTPGHRMLVYDLMHNEGQQQIGALG